MKRNKISNNRFYEKQNFGNNETEMAISHGQKDTRKQNIKIYI